MPNTTNQQAGSKKVPQQRGPLLSIGRHTDGSHVGASTDGRKKVTGSPGKTRFVLPHGNLLPILCFPETYFLMAFGDIRSHTSVGTDGIIFHFLGKGLYPRVSANIDFY